MYILGLTNFSAVKNFPNLNYQKKSFCTFGKTYNKDIYLSLCELKQQAHDKRIAEENKIIEKGQRPNATTNEKIEALKILRKREEELLRGQDFPEDIIQNNLKMFDEQIKALSK